MVGKVIALLRQIGHALKIAAMNTPRLVLGALFVYAGLRKAFATESFAGDIQNYAILSSADAILVLAIYLPWVEVAAGTALILRRLQLGALAIIAGLMLIFTGALTSAWVRGLDISCGCFAEEKPPTTRTHFPELLARDLALLLTAIALMLRHQRTLEKAAPAPAPAPPAKGDF